MNEVGDATDMQKLLSALKPWVKIAADWNFENPHKRSIQKFVESFKQLDEFPLVMNNVPASLKKARAEAITRKCLDDGKTIDAIISLDVHKLSELTGLAADDNELLALFCKLMEGVLNFMFEKASAQRKKDQGADDKLAGATRIVAPAFEAIEQQSNPPASALAMKDLCSLFTLKPHGDAVTLTDTMERIFSNKTQQFYRCFWSFDSLAMEFFGRAEDINADLIAQVESAGCINKIDAFCKAFNDETPAPSAMCAFVQKNLDLICKYMEMLMPLITISMVDALAARSAVDLRRVLEKIFGSLLKAAGSLLMPVMKRILSNDCTGVVNADYLPKLDTFEALHIMQILFTSESFHKLSRIGENGALRGFEPALKLATLMLTLVKNVQDLIVDTSAEHLAELDEKIFEFMTSGISTAGFAVVTTKAKPIISTLTEMVRFQALSDPCTCHVIMLMGPLVNRALQIEPPWSQDNRLPVLATQTRR